VKPEDGVNEDWGVKPSDLDQLWTGSDVDHSGAIEAAGASHLGPVRGPLCSQNKMRYRRWQVASQRPRTTSGWKNRCTLVEAISVAVKPRRQ
jgi:hypothetical protein